MEEDSLVFSCSSEQETFTATRPSSLAEVSEARKLSICMRGDRIMGAGLFSSVLLFLFSETQMPTLIHKE